MNPPDALVTIGRECNLLDVIQENGLDLSNELLKNLVKGSGMKIASGNIPIDKTPTAGSWDNARTRVAAEVKSALMLDENADKLKTDHGDLATYIAGEVVSQLKQANEDRGIFARVWSSKVKETVTAASRITDIQHRFPEMVDIVTTGYLEYTDSSGTHLHMKLNIKVTMVNFSLAFLEMAINSERKKKHLDELGGKFLDSKIKFYNPRPLPTAKTT